MKTCNYIGVDVSKDKLDIYNTGKSSVINNSLKAIKKFIASLTEYDVVIFEASGGYESLLANTLSEQSRPFCLENPRKIRDFARAAGVMAKTDALDARVISLYGERMQPRLSTPIDSVLCSLVARRDQLVEMRAAEKNRLQKAPERLHASINSTIEHFSQQIASIEKEIESYINSKPELKKKFDILITYAGIGPVAAYVLLAYLPELGTLDKPQIAALAGLAPLNRDSGTMRGKRTIFGGRRRVRATLYICALTASRFNSIIKQKRTQLALQNKPTKVILTACARKILIHLNAMIKNLTPFQVNIA
jgi:transposase